MRRFIIGLLSFFFATSFAIAQVPEGQPRQNQQQYDEQRQQEMEQEAPAQEPQQLEQEGEVTPPGEGQAEQEDAQNPDSPQQVESEGDIDRFENAKTMRYRQLPEAIRNDLENNFFGDWEVQGVYSAHELQQEPEVPADYVLKVQKEDVTMNLYYQGNGQLLMQEKGALHENLD
jgi:hemolysin activation/secretion protein